MTVSALSLGRLSSSPDHGPKPPPQSSLCARLEWLSISESQRKCWQRSNRSTDSLWPSVWGHHTDSIHRNETRWPFTLSCFFFERTFTGGYINTQTPKSSCYATEDPQTWTLSFTFSVSLVSALHWFCYQRARLQLLDRPSVRLQQNKTREGS